MDKHKSSFYRKLNLPKEDMEIIRIYNKLKKQMLREVEGKRK